MLSYCTDYNYCFIHPSTMCVSYFLSFIQVSSHLTALIYILLDTTHPEVREHIKDTLDTATNVWGFSYLKLDFLYSAVLGKEMMMMMMMMIIIIVIMSLLPIFITQLIPKIPFMIARRQELRYWMMQWYKTLTSIHLSFLPVYLSYLSYLPANTSINPSTYHSIHLSINHIIYTSIFPIHLSIYHSPIHIHSHWSRRVSKMTCTYWDAVLR